MSSDFRFDPGTSAILGAPWNITLLSQRDVGLRVPVNYVTHPAVYVTAACFGGRIYEDFAAAKCLSNLLSVGFRKLYLDLYWDSRRRSWSFCPVELPTIGENTGRETVVVPLAGSSTALVSAADRLRPRQTGGVSTIAAVMQTTEETSSTTIRKATLTVQLATSGNQAYASLPTGNPVNVQEVLYAVGPYQCSGTSAIDILTDLIPSYLHSTDDTLQAVMQYVVFNVHAAASIATPELPAARPNIDDMPSSKELLSQSFLRNSSTYLYTPTELRLDRLNLTRTWLDPDFNSTAPVAAYLNTDRTSGTLDGWPSSSYTEFRRQNHFRLMFGFGRIDPQMVEYNRTGDEHMIFPPGYINDIHEVTQSSAGVVTDGCIYNSNNMSLAAANNSWALAAVEIALLDSEQQRAAAVSYNQSLSSVTNLTSCGYSALLNSTLAGASADENVRPYREFALSSIWSWAWGEPRNAMNITSTDEDNAKREDRMRCAVMDPSIPGGRWTIANCSDSHPAACRVDFAPLEWLVSQSAVNYSMADGACPANATFAVPRTALENRYLLEAYRNDQGSSDSLAPLFINFNSLDVPDCWVTGVNTACPYEIPTDSSATIYIPTVAAVVILVLTVCLVLIKCGANRAHSRRRTKRGTDGWDYEGVPS